jgi:hypothetical protein
MSYHDDLELFSKQQHLLVEQLTVCLYKDHDRWCATLNDFVSFEESPAGFGDSKREALYDLIMEIK